VVCKLGYVVISNKYAICYYLEDSVTTSEKRVGRFIVLVRRESIDRTAVVLPDFQKLSS